MFHHWTFNNYLCGIEKTETALYLPFSLHRIIVKDKDGDPLFDHDWSETNISEKIFTGIYESKE